MIEKWKQISGFESLYEVSNLGNVRSVDRFVYNRKIKGKVLKQFNKGRVSYKAVCLCINKTKKSYTVHRLVAKAFIPNPQGKRCVNHIDGNKFNNLITNLEWCTNSENTTHAIKTGLINLRKSNTKLNSEKANSIRFKSRELKISTSSLANEYGIGESAIRRILRNEAWKPASY